MYFDAPRFDIRLSWIVDCDLVEPPIVYAIRWVPSFFFTKTIGAAHGLFDDLIMSWSSRVFIFFP